MTTSSGASEDGDTKAKRPHRRETWEGAMREMVRLSAEGDEAAGVALMRRFFASRKRSRVDAATDADEDGDEDPDEPGEEEHAHR